MGCGVYWQKMGLADQTLAGMREFGIAETDPAYQHIWHERGKLLGVIGQKTARQTSIILHVDMLSRMQTLGLEYASHSRGYTIEDLKDAVLKLWWDDEEGFMSEGRIKPGSPPIYRRLTDKEAFIFIKGEETGALIATAFTEDEYYGE